MTLNKQKIRTIQPIFDVLRTPIHNRYSLFTKLIINFIKKRPPHTETSDCILLYITIYVIRYYKHLLATVIRYYTHLLATAIHDGTAPQVKEREAQAMHQTAEREDKANRHP